jgi:hypothetical protein
VCNRTYPKNNISTQIFLNVVLSENAAFLDLEESAISYNQIFQFSNIEGKATYVYKII